MIQVPPWWRDLSGNQPWRAQTARCASALQRPWAALKRLLPLKPRSSAPGETRWHATCLPAVWMLLLHC